MGVREIEEMKSSVTKEEFEMEEQKEIKEMYRLNEIYEKLSPEEKEKRLKMLYERQQRQLGAE
tara:strand:+ start:5653 stop:5841 length:189 start_codon:yes stop_codon:yes gene_type:complete